MAYVGVFIATSLTLLVFACPAHATKKCATLYSADDVSAPTGFPKAMKADKTIYEALRAGATLTLDQLNHIIESSSNSIGFFRGFEGIASEAKQKAIETAWSFVSESASQKSPTEEIKARKILFEAVRDGENLSLDQLMYVIDASYNGIGSFRGLENINAVAWKRITDKAWSIITQSKSQATSEQGASAVRERMQANQVLLEVKENGIVKLSEPQLEYLRTLRAR